MYESENNQQPQQGQLPLGDPVPIPLAVIPLAYASPQASGNRISAFRVVAIVLTFLFGIPVGAIAVPFVLNDLHANDLSKQHFYTCLYSIAGIGAVLFILILAKWSRRAILRWGTLGFMLGCGLGLLVCGLCYEPR